MSDGVQIINQPEDYWDVFSSDLFNGTQRRPLNWLERSERRKNQTHKDGLTEMKRKETDE